MTPLSAGFTLFIAAAAGDAYVAEADRLVISGTSIQLSGVDAPPPNSEAGQAARAALSAMLEGRVVVCRVRPRRTDQMTRSGMCFVDEEDIAAGLVRAGLVLDCPRTSSGRYSDLEPKGSRDRLASKAACRNV